MKTITEQETRRLAYAKYLLNQAKSQLKQPEVLASVALLQLHDATEFFLQLLAEHYNLGKDDFPKTYKGYKEAFMAYWDLLAPKFQQGGLPRRTAMERMNKARVALKHHGNFPARSDLIDFNDHVNRFFEECTQPVFGVSLDSISLADFVSCKSAQKNLKDAVSALEARNFEHGLTVSALAFEDLLDDHKAKVRSGVRQSPFPLGQSLQNLTGLRLFQNSNQETIVRHMIDSIQKLQTSVIFLSLHLDCHRLTRFKQLVPQVDRFEDGKTKTRWVNQDPKLFEARELSFCIDFVIESALRLQDFDNE